MIGGIFRQVGLSLWVAASLVMVESGLRAAEKIPLRVGFVYDPTMLENVYSEKDVTVATQVLFGKILGTDGKFETTFRSFTSEVAFKEAIFAGELDYVEIGPMQFLRFSEDQKKKLIPLSVVQTGEERLDRLVMLAAPGASLESVRGKRLLLATDSIRAVAQLWVDYELGIAGGAGVRDYFDEVSGEVKSNGVLLQTFFGKADVCIVREGDYKLAVELNPQIGKRLVPLKVSPAFPIIMTMAVGKNREEVSKCMGEVVARISSESSAQQAFDLLKIKGIKEFQKGDLAEVTKIYEAVVERQEITALELEPGTEGEK